jgi:hypothetical protein
MSQAKTLSFTIPLIYHNIRETIIIYEYNYQVASDKE